MVKTIVLMVLAVGATAGCNEASQGANGNLYFSPMECGREYSTSMVRCEFDDAIAVGGSISVIISPVSSGLDTTGLRLVSQTPQLLEVTSRPAINTEPAWDLTALAAGTAVLAAVDENDIVVDFLEVDLQRLTGLKLENSLGHAERGEIADPSVEEWNIAANQEVMFHVSPVVENGASAMGRFDYDFTMDTVVATGLKSPARLPRGELQLSVPAGQYQVQFLAAGHTLTAHLHAK